jgi:hypothetical protein
MFPGLFVIAQGFSGLEGPTTNAISPKLTLDQPVEMLSANLV